MAEPVQGNTADGVEDARMQINSPRGYCISCSELTEDTCTGLPSFWPGAEPHGQEWLCLSCTCPVCNTTYTQETRAHYAPRASTSSLDPPHIRCCECGNDQYYTGYEAPCECDHYQCDSCRIGDLWCVHCRPQTSSTSEQLIRFGDDAHRDNIFNADDFFPYAETEEREEAHSLTLEGGTSEPESIGEVTAAPKASEWE